MKKFLKSVFLIILILVVFRGPVYRLFINYKNIGTREKIEITNQELIKLINAKSANRHIDAEAVADIANQMAKDELSFTWGNASNNPNELIISHKANCIGYSATFNSIANYLIAKNGLESEIQTRHIIGKLYFWGIDVHQLFSNPFFKDHDFNQIRDLKTGKTISIDPSIGDYLWIDEVSAE